MRGRRNKRRLAYIRKVYKNDPEVWVRVASVFLGLNVPIPGFRSAERQVAKAIEDAPDRMRGSALIPWLARETSRELKRFRALRRPVPPLPIPSAPENTTVALFTLQEPRKLADVIDWYSAPDGGAGTDLGKMSWLEALNKAEAWHEAMLKTEGRRLGAADQGSVTYRWSDGWTAQFLDTPELLEAEGEAMQNCIADYWDEVDRGDSVIVSLRNPRGQPRVTIQITQDLDKTWAAEGNLREVLQAEGRGQTQPPAPKYRARLKDLFGSLIGEDPQEWGDAGLAATHSDQEMWTLFREGHIADHQSLLGWVRTGLTAAQHAASRDLGWSDYPIPVWAQLPTGDDTLHTLQWKLQPSYITRPMLAAYVGKRLRSRLTPQGREFVDWRLDLHDAAPHELLGTLHGYRELDRFMFGPDRQLVGARSILGNLDKKVRKHLRPAGSGLSDGGRADPTTLKANRGGDPARL